MHIDSTNPVVQQNLQRIEALVTGNGGVIHPNMTVHHKDHMLWISCQSEALESPLLVIPNALFVPVTGLCWIEKEGLLAYEGETEHLTDTQRQLLEAMLTIYNQSGKLREVAENLPSVQLKNDAELLSWIQTAHPTFKLPDETPASQFMGTRLNDVVCSQDPSKKIGYLMPLIDYMNHHPYGASYERSDDGAWRVPQVYAVPESKECFLRYTNTDSHSIAFWHGYCETHTKHVASIQCQLQHPMAGTVHIISTNAKRSAMNAPCFLPDENDLTLKDIVLECKQIPALRALLGLAVRSKRRDLGQYEAEIVASELIQALIETNLRKYHELQMLCSLNIEKFPLRSLYSQVAAHQIALLNAMQAD